MLDVYSPTAEVHDSMQGHDLIWSDCPMRSALATATMTTQASTALVGLHQLGTRGVCEGCRAQEGGRAALVEPERRQDDHFFAVFADQIRRTPHMPIRPSKVDEIWLTPKPNSNSWSFAGRKELGRIPRLVFGYFPYVFRREMRRAGVVAPGGSPRWEIRIHCIWNRARYIVYTLYLEQISDIQAYCIYIVFGNGLDTLYIHCTWTAPDCISHLGRSWPYPALILLASPKAWTRVD